MTTKASKGEGPYRYRTDNSFHHAGVLNGWIMKRGHKWLYFKSVSEGTLKLPLDEERYMEKLS